MITIVYHGNCAHQVMFCVRVGIKVRWRRRKVVTEVCTDGSRVPGRQAEGGWRQRQRTRQPEAPALLEPTLLAPHLSPIVHRK